MTPEQIIKTAEDCGFTRTHTGEVELWLCNKNDLANFMHVIAEDAYHCGIQEGVVAGANNEREACAQICEQYSDTDTYQGGITTEFHAIMIRKRGEA